jgi:ADP-ribosyltransferase exoenzyme
LLANELEGMGKEMLEMRINGDSWAEIAKRFDLPNPSAARSKFTKLTGITDYKAKGQTLKMLANDLSQQASKTGIFEAKKAVKKADKALKVEKNVLDFTPDQLDHLAHLKGLGYDENNPVYKGVLNKYKAENLEKSAAEAGVKLDTKSIKWKSNQQLVEDTGLSPETVGKVIEMNQNGEGYLAIKNQLGIEFKQIDEVVWNSALKQADGDIWKAYQTKVTSQTGHDAVQEMVWDLKKAGFENGSISSIPGMPPKSIIDSISEGTWKLPPAGTKTVFIPPAPPPPPAIYGAKVESGFKYKSTNKMNEWIAPDTARLSPEARNAVSYYTGSGSSEINGFLRTGSTYGSPENAQKLVRGLDSAMRPIPEDMKVTRHVSTSAFGTDDLTTLVSDVFRDKGYLSTSVSETGAFTHHEVKMVIDVPKGAQGRYVQDISIHKQEKELLLARNTPIKINAVERTTGGRWVVYGEVIV